MTNYEHLVTARQLQQHLDDPNWRVVDCRFDLMAPEKGRNDYLAGHIPGAVYAHLDSDLAAPISATSGRHPLPTAEEFALKLGSWGIHNASQVVAYDNAGGATAARLWWMLRWLGHTNVAVLDGGLDAWLGQDGALEPGQVATTNKLFNARERPEMTISTEDLFASLVSGDDFQLLDARDRQRFAGAVEPIDAVAGHVPGAHNFPFTDGITSAGTWRAKQEMVDVWQRALGNRTSENNAVMCGSGVTACHLVLSAELAGFAAPRLYVGSWSEWIRDPTRPIATAAVDGDADSP